MWWILPILLLAVPAMAQPAMAQQPPPEPAPLRGLALALQQMAVATEQYISDVNRRFAEKDARIAELEKLCGDPCKVK